MADSFTPGPDDLRALRAAFGRFATGVTVITTTAPHGPVGITANSFSSVSLDPPLILWCLAKASRRHDAFATASHFALHVMGTDQDAITWGFANSAEAFGHCDWTPSEHGVPLIADCPARFECTIHDRIDAGDHSVILGEVTRVATNDTDPRIFLGGDYGRFRADER